MNRKIRVDEKTGEYFESGKLAPKAYARIMDETAAIKARVSSTFGFGKPVDKEVIVRYQNDAKEAVNKSKLVVEMEKERPPFFSKNLVQKARTGSNQESNTTVRPSGLG